MKDFLGKELEVGDEVIVANSTRSSTWLSKAIVMGFTPKMVRLCKPSVVTIQAHWYIKSSNMIVKVNHE